jgi:hypothetical protein
VIFEEDLDTAEIISTNTGASEQATDTEPSLEQSRDQQPVRTVEAVQTFFTKVYQVRPQDLEAKWAKFCLGVLGRPLTKGPLTQEELNKINGIISQAWHRKQTASNTSAA